MKTRNASEVTVESSLTIESVVRGVELCRVPIRAKKGLRLRRESGLNLPLYPTENGRGVYVGPGIRRGLDRLASLGLQESGVDESNQAAQGPHYATQKTRAPTGP